MKPIRFPNDAELGWVPKRDTQPNILGTAVTILENGIRSNGNEGVRDEAGPILAVGDFYTLVIKYPIGKTASTARNAHRN